MYSNHMEICIKIKSMDNQSMEITDKIIKAGTVRISKTDYDSWAVVEDYNNHMIECNRRMKYVKEIRFGIRIINPLVIFALNFKPMDGTISLISIETLIILVVCAAYLCSIIKDDYVLLTISTILLLKIDLLFIILVITNIILTALFRRKTKPLKKEPDYPRFQKIQIIYEDSDFYETKDIVSNYNL